MAFSTEYVIPTIKICGEVYEVEEGDPFVSTVTQYGRDAGFRKIRVFLIKNGVEEEISESAPPAVFESGMEVVIKSYEKPGLI